MKPQEFIERVLKKRNWKRNRKSGRALFGL